MSLTSIFTPAEWYTLQYTVFWIFFPIAVADGKKKPNDKEIAILLKEINEASLYKEPLSREVLESIRANFQPVFQSWVADSRAVDVGLKDMANLLDRKATPQQIYNFKRDMLVIGYNVVETAGKGFMGMGSGAHEKKLRMLDGLAMLMRFTMSAPPAGGAPAGTLSPTPGIVRPGATPVPIPSRPVAPVYSKHSSIYMVLDSSRYISDSAFFLDHGLRRLPEQIRKRPQKHVRPDISLILADNSGRIATPLTEAANFAAPSLVGRGKCCLGQALSSLMSDIACHPSDSKPLVILVLGGQPEDEWISYADQLRGLCQRNQANVFVFGVGGFDDPVVLRRLTTQSPLALNDVTVQNVEHAFDWMYSILDVILTGVESGATGQRGVPPPPACLRVLS